ncbi:MAG TPA: ATP-dependent DNA helicase RecQ [Polyangiales bacterium]
MRELAAQRFDIRSFRAGQLQLMEAVLAGRNALGVMPTGAGKSLTFQLPALLLPKTVVVVSPLISLMQDQHEKLEELDVPAARLNSSIGAAEARQVERALREGGLEILYVTPERLEQEECVGMLRARGVSLVVVDEAHCVSQWGHDFRPAYLTLREAIRALGRPPVLALTATATPDMIGDILTQLDIEGADVVRTGVERPNLRFRVERTPRLEQKQEQLLRLLREGSGSSIVYATTIRTASSVQEYLCSQGVEAGLYHGRLPTRERTETQDRFMRDALRVVVATSAFGLGIDKPDVRLVVHYNFPASLETYYQEAGRAGRDGLEAQAVLLYRLEDKRLHSFFVAGKYPERAEQERVLRCLMQLQRTQGARHWTTLTTLAERADVSPKRTKVIVANLEAAELVRRGGARVRLEELPDDDAALERLLAAYEERRRDDQQRIEAMMHYAQSPVCRMQQLRAYFGQHAGDTCGHCDNCQRPARTAPRSARSSKLAKAPAAAQVVERLVASAVGNVAPEDVIGR